jgi:glycosyltransferase involved in cell wall biosynthesis
MIPDAEPLVSVLTPVYNGEAYLAQSIESVMAQTYKNWEYIILNNASIDNTLQIAEHYAQLDNRIIIHSNDVLIDIIANHNRAFSLISAFSKYTKIVSADDWLFPECLSRMVALAEANPSVGIVGSYQMSGGGTNRTNWSVKFGQVAYPATVIPGHEICRSHLMGEPYVFGSPTSILYRSDLVRAEERFYPNSSAEADSSACYKQLQKTDYGFVHQVLSYERDEHVRTSTRSQSMNAYLSSHLSDLREYGETFLTAEERKRRFDDLMSEYYRFLAFSALKRREDEFWAYHKDRFRALGIPFSKVSLIKAMSARLFRPLRALGKVFDGGAATYELFRK